MNMRHGAGDGARGTTPGGIRAARPRATRAQRAFGSFSSYEDAERAVDFLSDHRFPVDGISIVGRDLRYVEEVTGRSGYPQAAVRGAAQGALLGLLFGWVLGLFNWVAPLVTSLTLAAYGLVAGAILGALLGLLVQAVAGGDQGFSSVGGVQADRYDLLVDDAVADEAMRLLGTRPR